MPIFTGGGAAAATSTALIVQEDDSTVVTACTTLDFTEPLVTLVTESPAGEANINMARYFLASGARDVTGTINSRDIGVILTSRNGGDTDDRLVITQSSIKWGAGLSGQDIALSHTATAGLGEFKGNWQFQPASSLIFRDTNDSNETTFTAGNQIVDIDYTFPVALLNTGVLSVTSAGVMSWIALANAKGGFTAGSVIFAGSAGELSQDNAAFFWDITNDRLGLGTIAPGSILETEELKTLSGALGDGTAAMHLLDPGYTGAFTVTRHNYIKCEDVSVAASAVVTNACVLWFDAAAGTHKAVDAGTTKVSIGVVTQWIKVNVNGTVAFIPSYSSKTS